MIVGTITQGGTATNLAVDKSYLSGALSLGEQSKLVKITLPLDGGGSGTGDQTLRAMVYEGAAGGALLGTSDEVVIADGAALEWVDFAFPDLPLLPVGDYYLAVGASSATTTARAYGTGALTSTTDTYADGPLATVPGSPSLNAGLSIFALLIAPYAPGEQVSDRQIATLPMPNATAVFGSSAPDSSMVAAATCGWHGSRFAQETGAFAIVKLDGPLSDYVGERVQVRYEDRTTYVFVYDERDIIEDISLTRRAFMDLAEPSADELDVTVTAMGSA